MKLTEMVSVSIGSAAALYTTLMNLQIPDSCSRNNSADKAV